jgi:16S rRNA (uracil1498-N3)-methyltransferase
MKHAQLRRFFVQSPVSIGPVEIGGSEAHHIVNVNRIRVGEQLVLFDGSGRDFVGTVQSIGASAVRILVDQMHLVDRELATEITMAVALPRGDRQKTLVEKLVELGVSTLIPLTTSRSVVKPTPQTLTKLKTRVIEASKQCGRNRLMSVTDPLSWEQLVGSIRGSRFVAFPAEQNLQAGTAAAQLNAQQPVCIAIGPEGDFEAREIALAIENGWQAISLGPIVLRVETAAIAVAAIFGIGRQPPSRNT